MGLMIDPESVFGVDPVDFGPMTISMLLKNTLKACELKD